MHLPCRVVAPALLAFALVGAFLQPAGGDEPQRLALLVGISNYDHQHGQPPDWWDLSSQADIFALRDVLKSRFGFQDNDVKLLEDEQATAEGIEAAFRKHLIAQARPGAIVYFHYSGHGQPVLDDNDDEFDGLDESFVTSNYKSQSAADGAKTNLRDDVLGKLLGELQAKMIEGGELKGDIVVTLDSCFSGTATRAPDLDAPRLTQRGRGWLPLVDGDKPAIKRGASVDTGSGLLKSGEAKSQGYVLLTATSHDELASQWPSPDGGSMGAFTAFLVRELERATPETTYRSVFERVNAVVSSKTHQNPQLEGRADALLFSGIARERESYYVVKAATGDELSIDEGAVHGILPGSVFQIFPPGAEVKDRASVIAEAEATVVHGSRCDLKLAAAFRGKLKADKLLGARIVETDRPYSDSTLKLLVDPAVPAELSAELKTLKLYTTDGVTKKNFDVSVQMEKIEGKREAVVALPGRTLLQIDVEEKQFVDRVIKTLKNEFRSRFLRQLRNDEDKPLVKVEIRAVPVDVEMNTEKNVIKATRQAGVTDDTGRSVLQLNHGEDVMLEVRNVGSLPAYLTILHFQQEGEVYCVFPDREDNKFEPGEKWVPLGNNYVFRAEADDKNPTGLVVETFKVIATLQPSNYRDILPPKPVPGSTERAPAQVRGAVARHPSQPRGQSAATYDLARYLATAMLGEDPDPKNAHGRSPTLPVTSDWNAADVKVETRKGQSREY